METFLEIDLEEQRRLERRKARREQMLKEKRRQLERRRKMKKILILGSRVSFVAVALAVITVCMTSFFNTIKKKRETGQEKENIALTSGLALVEEREEVSAPSTAKGDSRQRGEKEQQEIVSRSVHKPQLFQFQYSKNKKYIYNEEIISTNAILIDESKNTIVAARGERERISPASMTKVLTILVAAENIKEEQLEDTFTMTLDITDYGYINDCSSVGFLEGEQVKVRDLFYGTILQSGADAALGLACYVSGSQEVFVDLMNEKLEELGLDNTSHFTNCVGVHDKEHYSTVYDMAVIMKAAISNELCKEVLSKHTYTTQITKEHPEGITISNWFLRRIEDKDTGGLVLCAKTGFVEESKSCAVSYGSFKGETTYICVTVGAHSSWRCIYDHVEIYNRYVES